MLKPPLSVAESLLSRVTGNTERVDRFCVRFIVDPFPYRISWIGDLYRVYSFELDCIRHNKMFCTLLKMGSLENLLNRRHCQGTPVYSLILSP